MAAERDAQVQHPWVELDGVSTGFIRPELYVIEAFNLLSLYMRQIYAIIKIVAECYPQRGGGQSSKSRL